MACQLAFAEYLIIPVESFKNCFKQIKTTIGKNIFLRTLSIYQGGVKRYSSAR